MLLFLLMLVFDIVIFDIIVVTVIDVTDIVDDNDVAAVIVMLCCW